MKKLLTPEFLIGLSFFQLLEPAPVDFIVVIIFIFQYLIKINFKVFFITIIITAPTLLFDFYDNPNFLWINLEKRFCLN